MARVARRVRGQPPSGGEKTLLTRLPLTPTLSRKGKRGDSFVSVVLLARPAQIEMLGLVRRLSPRGRERAAVDQVDLLLGENLHQLGADALMRHVVP